MRIRSVRFRNFRGFADETFSFDPASGRASVQRFGERLIFKKFAPFFEDEKNKATVDSLRERFKAVINGVVDFLVVGAKPTKKAMVDSLCAYEVRNPSHSP